jgi:Mg-chelatase subunit ChlD
MRFANPTALWLLALAIPVLLLHVLRPRRQPLEVASTFLWEAVSTPVSAASPWQKLKPSILLLVQLLAVALLAVAVAQPVRVTPAPFAQHTVFIIDASGSMGAIDGHPDRLNAAKERAAQLRTELSSDGKASIVVASPQPQVLLTASPDEGAFEDALRPIQVSDGAADFGAAFTLASSLETPDAPIGFVLLSDGGMTDDQKRLLLPGLRYERIGEQATNRAITKLIVEPRGSGLHAVATVKNTGGPAATQSIRFDVDGKTVVTSQIQVAEGATIDVEQDLPPGDQIAVHLEGEDLLASDNHAYAVAAVRRELKILVMGKPNVFLDQLLAVTAGVKVERSEEAKAATGYDLAIYDQVDVPEDPGAPFIAIAPPNGVGAIKPGAPVSRPIIVLVRSDDELLRDVDLSNVQIGTAQKIETPPTAETLVGAEGVPLLVRGTLGNRPFVYFAFGLADSTLPLDIAFPILADRLLTNLASAELPPTDLVVGAPLPVDPGAQTAIVDPAGDKTAVSPGHSAPVATRPGFWTITPEGGAEQRVAVNVAPGESRLQPEQSLPVPVRPPDPNEKQPVGEHPVLVWIVALALVLLALEFLLSRRRLGVGRKQWRVAVALRTVIVLLLVAALLDLGYSHPAERVATVFLIDASDSVGPTRRAEEIAWVQDALRNQPPGSLSSIALFGGDARLESTMQEANVLGTPTVKIDATRTDLATALRLAGAVLPSDARRRIVLLSDGRSTQGDVAGEAAKLEQSGIEVDVHTVGKAGGTDAAIDYIDVPKVVHKGDKVELSTKITATAATTATVAVDEDGKVLDTKTVDLVVGDNDVTFSVEAATEGVHRYRVTVSANGDSVSQNNAGYVAATVEGPAKVLLVEGKPGESDTLAKALRSANINVDIVAPADLPPLDALSLYTSVVLVDVDVHDLSNDQVATLVASTRDLGHGLITIGGERAYGLGGYRDSELEKVLPVISEITDPKRRRSVAQVLAIDTSGSMGACHCADGNNGVIGGNMVEGGVSKTDISRSAAARAIDALSKDDEIGLLSINSSENWVIDLQQLPSSDVVKDGLNQLHPSGGTDLNSALKDSADKLRSSKASLKHIILFTDGFTSTAVLDELAKQAADLKAEGITVSVLATGEGSAKQLEDVAKAGGGRFYPGRDLSQIPQIMQQEVVLASRDFIQEGEFYPEITGTAPEVRDLATAPPLLGYVATTARPQATQIMKIGPEGDPLIASWQQGLGKVVSWTSDASAKWSQQWSSWDGYVNFWSALIKDTYPGGTGNGTGAVQARVRNGRLEVRLENETAFPDGATATARVTGPDLQGHDVTLDRVDGKTFAGDLSATASGTYAVGAQVKGPDGVLFSATGLASASYSPEYLPGDPDLAAMKSVSEITHGRGEITSAQAFDANDLEPGTTRVALAVWMLLAAALLWPIALALSRLSFRGTAVKMAAYRAGVVTDAVRSKIPSRPGAEGGPGGPSGRDVGGSGGRGGRGRSRTKPDRPEKYIDVETEERLAREAAPPPTIGRLLDRKRGTSSSPDDSPP